MPAVKVENVAPMGPPSDCILPPYSVPLGNEFDPYRGHSWPQHRPADVPLGLPPTGLPQPPTDTMDVSKSQINQQSPQFMDLNPAMDRGQMGFDKGAPVGNPVAPMAPPAKKGSSRRNAWGSLSYADLITKAIETTPEGRLTLSQIYDWMVRNVPYFKDKGDSNSSAGWKNSIRHNLSLHNRFMRIQNEGTGKSSWWVINPDAKPGKSLRRRPLSDTPSSKYERKRGRQKKKVDESVVARFTTGVIGNGKWMQHSPTASPKDELINNSPAVWNDFRAHNTSNANRLSPAMVLIPPHHHQSSGMSPTHYAPETMGAPLIGGPPANPLLRDTTMFDSFKFGSHPHLMMAPSDQDQYGYSSSGGPYMGLYGPPDSYPYSLGPYGDQPTLMPSLDPYGMIGPSSGPSTNEYHQQQMELMMSRHECGSDEMRLEAYRQSGCQGNQLLPSLQQPIASGASLSTAGIKYTDYPYGSIYSNGEFTNGSLDSNSQMIHMDYSSEGAPIRMSGFPGSQSIPPRMVHGGANLRLPLTTTTGDSLHQEWVH